MNFSLSDNADFPAVGLAEGTNVLKIYKPLSLPELLWLEVTQNNFLQNMSVEEKLRYLISLLDQDSSCTFLSAEGRRHVQELLNHWARCLGQPVENNTAVNTIFLSEDA